MDWYGAPGGEYAPRQPKATAAIRARTPSSSGKQLFGERGVDIAILHPMTRGIMPDRHLGTAIAAAHNEMMVSRWLEDNAFADRFRGTIRVNPDDITGALREIAKYTDHPQRGADRRPAAVARALRQAAVLAAVGGRRRGESAGARCTSRSAQASRSRRRRTGSPRTYEHYRQLHVAELTCTT